MLLHPNICFFVYLFKDIPHCWLCVSYLQMYVNLLFWYQFFCGFSGSVMTNSWVLILFNLIFTSAPPLIYGILNQDLPADTLMELPELYQDAQTSKVTANTHIDCYIYLAFKVFKSLNVNWFYTCCDETLIPTNAGFTLTLLTHNVHQHDHNSPV